MINLKNCMFGLFAITLIGCQQDAATPKNSESDSVDKKEQKLPANYSGTGTVNYYKLEGGFFGITTKKGEKLLPMNLTSPYQQENAVITFSGRYVEDMKTIQQWGKPFFITHIKMDKPGKPVAPEM